MKYDIPNHMIMPSGMRVNPFLYNPLDFNIADIACNLSLINRFGGYVHWSVGQHSLLVENILLHNEKFKDRAAKLDKFNHVRMYALLHDAPEAYLGDVISPVKRYGVTTAYRDADLRIMQVITDLLGLKVSQLAMDLVHEADVLAMYVEATALRPDHEAMWRINYPHMRKMVSSNDNSFVRENKDNHPPIIANRFKERFFTLFQLIKDEPPEPKPETTN